MGLPPAASTPGSRQAFAPVTSIGYQTSDLPSGVAQDYLQNELNMAASHMPSFAGLGEIEDLDFIFKDLVDVGRFDLGMVGTGEETVVLEMDDIGGRMAQGSAREIGGNPAGSDGGVVIRQSGAGKVKKKTEELRRKVDAARKTVEGCPVGIEGNPISTSPVAPGPQLPQIQMQILHPNSINPAALTSRGREGAQVRGKDCKRRKVCQACIHCRKAHMSCDEVRPCGRCIKRGMAHLCVDAPKKVDQPKPCFTCPVSIAPAPPVPIAANGPPMLRPASANSAAGFNPAAPFPMPPLLGQQVTMPPGAPPTNFSLQQQLSFFNMMNAHANIMATEASIQPAMSSQPGTPPHKPLDDAKPAVPVYPQSSFAGLLKLPDTTMEPQNPPVQAVATSQPLPPASVPHYQPYSFNPYASHLSLMGGLGSNNPPISMPHPQSLPALMQQMPNGSMTGRSPQTLSGLPASLMSFAPHSTTVAPPRKASMSEQLQRDMHSQAAAGREPTPTTPYPSQTYSPLAHTRSPTPGTPQSVTTPLVPAQKRVPTPTPNSSGVSRRRSSQGSFKSAATMPPACASFQSFVPAQLQKPQTLFASSSIGSEFAALAELWATVSTTTQNEQAAAGETSAVPHTCSSGADGQKRCNTCPFTALERFYLTAAGDQPSSLCNATDRLTNILSAKRKAGLLQSHDYTAGYARLGHHLTTQCSSTSRQRVLTVVSSFQTGFAALARNITDSELVSSEETFERLLLEYDTMFSMMGIPSAVWRRTGEIVRANQAFADLVGLDIRLLTGGMVCVYELLNEDSGVGYWERFGRVAFDSEEKGWMGTCTVRHRRGDSVDPKHPFGEREIKCAYSVTVRRDTVGVPLLCAGNFLKSFNGDDTHPLVIPDWVQEGLDITKKRAADSATTTATTIVAAPLPSPAPRLGPDATNALTTLGSKDVATLVDMLDGPESERDLLRRALEDLVGVGGTPIST
ncbi:hypothetical protein PhCBS80983_g01428 [Powellomyces hirtus]|uniref:Zn(2)-C6 fungal-type domain-containing protein n=1 Tax=Powellomyces hirtus TaxID=109895 RepID=A0A507EC35_9FUNG|nr:hypothetical protein PhCBS80983_g01428 [Powellomyces hirtus]